jgi:hypothetical protein
VDQPQRGFLRDLALILGLPALLVVGLVAWWKPWDHHSRPVVTASYAPREAHARAAALRDTTWHGLHVTVPEEYVLVSQDSVLEVLEWERAVYGDGNWGSHLAFLPLTSVARRRFQQGAENCALAPGRGWEETAGRHRLACQQAAGAPVPELWWTPLAICEVQDVGLWLALNAPEARRAEMWELARAVLRDAQGLDRPGSLEP